MLLLVYFQANTYEELPEQVIGAARLSNVEPSTAVVPDLENNSDSNKDNSSNDATSSEDDSSKKTNWFDFSLKISMSAAGCLVLFIPFKLCCARIFAGLHHSCSLVDLLGHLQLSPELQTWSFISFSLQSVLILHINLWRWFSVHASRITVDSTIWWTRSTV